VTRSWRSSSLARKTSFAASSCVASAALVLLAGAAGAAPSADWGRFGYDPARRNAGPAATGITAANVAKLVRRQVSLPGTVDSSPIFAGGLVVATTSYGRTIAVDPRTGAVRWRFTPSGYASWAGSARITNSSPIASADDDFVYAAAPDGMIHKLVLRTGKEVRSGHWPARVTLLPDREKLGTALNLNGNLLFVTTGGYIGDAPPYQGHVVVLDAASGRTIHVWNSLCSDRTTLIDPSSCPESGSAIWARSGAVLDPATGNVLVATGDGKWDGRRYWGDSVLMLSPDAGRLLQNWTPANQANLDSGDVDLGSTAPAILPGRLAVQSGKDAVLRLLDLRKLNGKGGAGPTTGGELQTLDTPGRAGVFSAPAVWRDLVFVTTQSGTGAYRLAGRRLHPVWEHPTAGTSPVVAGGLLYVYDPGGALNVYAPASGRELAHLQAGTGHWSSPIVAQGRVVLPEGNANDHSQSGVLDIYRLP
jgi:outer membrane protein assembly factor BamB